MLRQHLDAGSDGGDLRRADEDRVERGVEADDGEVGLEAVDLAAVGVSAHGDVDHAEAALIGTPAGDLGGQQDHAGARAEHGQPVGEQFGQRLEQARGGEQAGHRRRLPAGHHQCVDRAEVVGGADLLGSGAQRLEGALVRLKRAL